MRTLKFGLVGASLLAIVACTAAQQQSACARFRQAEANPLVQLAVAGGTMAANVETAGAAGPIVASIKSFGDNYCRAGPPVGDTTTPVQQASWLDGVTAKLLAAVR
jgi:hypothetical protein